MIIVGLRTEQYIDTAVSGHNCDFTYTKETFTKHILCAVKDNGVKLEITLRRSEGECGSGWTTASFGHCDVAVVHKFNGFTHVPIEMLEIDEFDPNTEDISNIVFDLSKYGGDDYYPSGHYSVNMNLFMELPGRAKSKRPVWIFQGKSGAGKSFLASKLKDLDVYETDSSDTLPDEIEASVIVLGNRTEFLLEDVMSRTIGDVEIYLVNFQ